MIAWVLAAVLLLASPAGAQIGTGFGRTGAPVTLPSGVYLRTDCTELASPVQGTTFCFEASTNQLKYYSGAAWVADNGNSQSIGLGTTSPYKLDEKALIVGSATASSRGQVGIVGNFAGGTVGRVTFHDAGAGVGADKRVGAVHVGGDGTTSGVWDFYGSNGGALHRVFMAADTGPAAGNTSFGIGPGTAGDALHIFTHGDAGIAIQRNVDSEGSSITFAISPTLDGTGIIGDKRYWVLRADSPSVNGNYFRIMDVDRSVVGISAPAVSRFQCEGMKSGIASAPVITAGASYYGCLFPTTGVIVKEAASGTHPIIATMAVDPLTITNGAGATTATATLYVSGVPSGIAPTQANYALLVGGTGVSRFDGRVVVGGTNGQFAPDTAALQAATVGGANSARMVVYNDTTPTVGRMATVDSWFQNNSAVGVLGTQVGGILEATHATAPGVGLYFSASATGSTAAEVARFVNSGHLIFVERTTDPSAAQLTSGANAKDRLTIYMKNDKLVFAYNNAGTVTYVSLPLDGSSTTWSHGTTAP